MASAEKEKEFQKKMSELESLLVNKKENCLISFSSREKKIKNIFNVKRNILMNSTERTPN